MLVLLSRFLLAFCLASILENWRQKINIGDFFGSNIFGARATPDYDFRHKKGERKTKGTTSQKR
jgi:hypothetical protein